jgi:hypothetical protein
MTNLIGFSYKNRVLLTVDGQKNEILWQTYSGTMSVVGYLRMTYWCLEQIH